MIYFKTIRWKNLLSTGNQFTEIQLDKSSTTLIVGDNGSGKSTILDALCFGLFNKPFRKINRPQLINSVNDGGLLVEIEFDIGSRYYKIRRGIKKNIFEIYVNYQLLFVLPSVDILQLLLLAHKSLFFVQYILFLVFLLH